MKKSIYALFLFIFCVFSMCGFYGCASMQTNGEEAKIHEKNAFRIVRQAEKTGRISLSYIFPVNTAILIENEIEDKDINAYKFYLTTYVNALAKSNKENEIEGVKVGNCQYFTDIDGLGFTIHFENLQAQKDFFGIKDEDVENSEKSKQITSGFFIRKTEIKTVFPISSTKAAGDLKMICSMAISSWCNDNKILADKKINILESLNSSIYIYDFANQESGLQSNLMYEDDKFFHNVFIKTIEEIEQNNEIVFWISSANRPIWYLSALFVVVTGMIVSFVATKKIKKKAKS